MCCFDVYIDGMDLNLSRNLLLKLFIACEGYFCLILENGIMNKTQLKESGKFANKFLETKKMTW